MGRVREGTRPMDPLLAIDMPKGAVKYSVIADIANFAVDKFVMDQRIEAQSLRVYRIARAPGGS